MDFKRIDQLLEKYWEGNCSIEEEQELRNYFNGQNIEPKHQYAQSYFSFIKNEGERNLRKAKATEILAGIDKGGKLIKMPAYYFLRIAAAVLIIFGALFLGKNTFYPNQDEMACYRCDSNFEDDPEKAMATTKAALLLVSKKLRKGKKRANKGILKLGKTTKFIKLK